MCTLKIVIFFVLICVYTWTKCLWMQKCNRIRLISSVHMYNSKLLKDSRQTHLTKLSKYLRLWVSENSQARLKSLLKLILNWLFVQYSYLKQLQYCMDLLLSDMVLLVNIQTRPKASGSSSRFQGGGVTGKGTRQDRYKTGQDRDKIWQDMNKTGTR